MERAWRGSAALIETDRAARTIHAVTLPRTLPRTRNFTACLEAQHTFSCSCQRKQPGKSSQAGKKLNSQPRNQFIQERERRKKKKNRSSNAGQEEAARVDCLLASPGAPGRGACPRKAGQRGALAGSGRGAPVPPAPAGSMNESAWK